MGLFGFGKKKAQEKVDGEGAFIGFVLLEDASWDRDKLERDFLEDWNLDIHEELDDSDEDGKDAIVVEVEGSRLMIGYIPVAIPNGEAEHFAAANYLWEDAVETTKKHKAQLIVSILGDNPNMVERGQLFTKAVATCLKQENALAVYTDGAVFQPEFYRDVADMMKEDELPILDWVWFGIYRSQKQAGIYTYGMRKFGKHEIEVYVDIDKVDLNEIREFMYDITAYVLSSDVTLKHGETIGFSATQKLPITFSKGIAVDGKTLKIAYES